jgi:putative NIF3 family GTP cyclohydrolase 1 type 2
VKFSTGEQISSVVICTGLGGMVIDQAAASKADCYITGELFSSSVKEYGFKAVIEVGHTLTEFIGVDLFRSLLPALQIDSAPLKIDYFNFETSIGD